MATGKIELASLMQHVLAEQQPGEDINTPLERVIPKEHAENADKIILAIEQCLKFQQDRFGQSSQQAAESLANSQAFLSIDSEGKTFLETFSTQVQGLENLSPKERQLVMEQFERAIREGKPQEIVIRRDMKAEASSRWAILLIVVVFGILILAYLFSRR